MVEAANCSIKHIQPNGKAVLRTENAAKSANGGWPACEERKAASLAWLRSLDLFPL
jgi:hypothetical protein